MITRSTRRLWLPANLIFSTSYFFLLTSSFFLSPKAAHQSIPVNPQPGQRQTGFHRLDPIQTGIQFTNRLSEPAAAVNRILENGSGVALGDVDGDGLTDIYFCRLEGSNALFRNRGQWRFQEITALAGVACENQYSSGAVFADTDGDGDLDLLVNSIGGGTRHFFNDGKGKFSEDLTGRLTRRFGATSMALADIDGDQDLDLFVANYRANTYKDNPPDLKVETRIVNGKVVVSPADRFIPITPRDGRVEVIEMGEHDFLYLNTGKGIFAPVSWTQGSFLDAEGNPLAAPPADWGLAVAFRDLNQDRQPDLYICNDFFHSPDQLWLNTGAASFKLAGPSVLREVSLSSMAVDFADINRDGHDDFIVVDMLSRDRAPRHWQRPNTMRGLVVQPLEDPNFQPEIARNTLFLSRGDGTFAEAAQICGLDATEWSWGALFLDIDLDGFEDLIIPGGNNHDVQDADVLAAQEQNRELPSFEVALRKWRQFPRLAKPILAFRNSALRPAANSQTIASSAPVGLQIPNFAETGAAWGFIGDHISHGAALGDLDNDGDLDLVVNHLQEFAGIYRNESTRPRLLVRLQGRGANTRGVGARITVTSPQLPSQSQEMMGGGRYLSSDDYSRCFATGSPTNRLRIEVVWRSGITNVVESVLANSICIIQEPDSAPISPAGVPIAKPPPPPPPTPLFADVSSRLNHRHQDDSFDDFERQPLLTRRFSRLGPGIAWHDFDSDGDEDLAIGAGRGGQLALFLNQGSNSFARADLPGPVPSLVQDQSGILGWSRHNSVSILLGLAPDSSGLAATNSTLEFRFGTTNLTPHAVAAFEAAAIGPLAMADIDLDGDLDLFIGGRLIPGAYPRPPQSRLLINNQGAWHNPEPDAAPFANIGMVSGAVFTDFDADGDPDLALAIDWGPIRIFRNTAGKFQESTLELGLASLTGGWNGITAADFDGDGRLDLVASNWGRNTRYQRFLDRPLRLYYGDFDRNGIVDLLETQFDPALNGYAPWLPLDAIRRGWPSLASKFQSFHAFAATPIDEILAVAQDRDRVTYLEASTLDSVLLLNRTNHFEIRPLPAEAQLSPAFGLCSADFNGDGYYDLFLSQNFSDVDPEISRYSAGRGLLLLGDGHGGFKPLSSRDSGILIPGEQRGCAAADFDNDGRLDLAVAENGGPTHLFHNSTASPGLSIKLPSTTENPHAIGTHLRPIYLDGTLGPVSEVRAGNGYWSQDSPKPIITPRDRIRSLQVRSPTGRISEVSVPQHPPSITIPL